MTSLYFQVAQVAHNRHISEFGEFGSPVPFAQEQFLTGASFYSRPAACVDGRVSLTDERG